MQTINTIPRSGTLNNVLQQQGLSAESYDAIAAANTLGSGPEIPTSEPVTAESGSHALMQKISRLEQSKHLLAGRISDMQKELESTQQLVGQLVQRIDGLQTTLRNQRSAPVEAPVVPTEQLVAEPAPIAAQAAPVQETAPVQSAPVQAEAERHPRQGVADESVSIENVFYCGTR